MYQHTAPGGYVELVELQSSLSSDDNSIPENSPINTFFSLWHQASSRIGIHTPNDMELYKYCEDAGFEDIRVYVLKQPCSPWPMDPMLKKVGQYMLLNVETAYMSYGLAMFTRVLGMTVEEATRICAEVARESMNINIHIYSIWYGTLGINRAKR
jgi:hypothetical protein